MLVPFLKLIPIGREGGALPGPLCKALVPGTYIHSIRISSPTLLIPRTSSTLPSYILVFIRYPKILKSHAA